MKIVFGIFSTALAAPFNQCPGTCWTENNGVCTPDLNEVPLKSILNATFIVHENFLFCILAYPVL